MARQREPKINDELAFFLKPLTAEERADLRQSIIEDGIREKVIVWEETGFIVDGHNRWDISRELKINCPTVAKSFKDMDDVKRWMAKNQTGRRNLTPEALAYLRGMEYLRERKPIGYPGKSEENGQICHDDILVGSTAEVLAEKHDVSPSTIMRDAQFAQGVEALPEEEKKKVLAGESDLTKKEIIAAAPVFCRSCRISIPKKDCVDCLKLRGKPQPKKPKSGAMKFDWATYKKKLGVLIRANDQIATGYDCKGSVGHKKALALLGEYVDHMKVWEKELTKGE